MSTSTSTKLLHAGALVVLMVAGFALARSLQSARAPAASAETPSSPAPSGAIASAWSPAGQDAARSGGLQATPAQAAPAARQQRLTVALRLDPALTQSLFMGDRWVSPADFHFAQPGSTFVVQAKAQHLDRRGDRHDVTGQWNATDPRMVMITRDSPQAVTIEVRRPGDSDLTLSAAGATVVLHVHAVQLADAMDVHIRQ